MAFTQGSRSALAYSLEGTFGENPSTPNMTLLPINTHDLSLSKDGLESQEIRSDRQIDVFRHGARRVGGTITGEFRADDWDALLEGALFGDFSGGNYAGILKAGTTRKSFLFEDQMLDINQYRYFTGCMVNTFGLTVASNQITTCEFGIVGKDSAISGTALDATPTATSGNEPFDGNNYIADVTEGGSPISIVTELSLQLENNLEPTFVIGETSTPYVQSGRSRLTGSMTAFFENTSLINKFINETESEIQFTLTDNITGNSYQFYLPRVKYNSAPLPLDNEQSRLVTLNWVALYDSVEQTQIVITKS